MTLLPILSSGSSIGSPLSPPHPIMDSWVPGNNTVGNINSYAGTAAASTTTSVGTGTGNGLSFHCGNMNSVSAQYATALNRSQSPDLMSNALVANALQLPRLPASVSGSLPPPPPAGSISLITSPSPVQQQQHQTHQLQQGQHSYNSSQVVSHQQPGSTYFSRTNLHAQQPNLSDYHVGWGEFSSGSPTDTLRAIGNSGVAASSQPAPYMRNSQVSQSGARLATSTSLPSSSATALLQQHASSMSSHVTFPSLLTFNQHGQHQQHDQLSPDSLAQQGSQPSLPLYAQQSNAGGSAPPRSHQQTLNNTHYYDTHRFNRQQPVQSSDLPFQQLTHHQPSYLHSQPQHQFQPQIHPFQQSLRHDQQQFSTEQYSDQPQQSVQHAVPQDFHTEQSHIQIRNQQASRSGQQHIHFQGPSVNSSHPVDFNVAESGMPEPMLAPLLHMNSSTAGPTGTLEDGSVTLVAKYACEICGESFRQKRARDTHIRTQHERSFGCGRCPSRFKTRSDANRHNRIVHLKQKPFACLLCKSVFAERGKLRRHTMTVHEKLRRMLDSLLDFSFDLGLMLSLVDVLSKVAVTNVIVLSLTSRLCFHIGVDCNLVSLGVAIVNLWNAAHVCQQCGAAFGERGNLNQHLTSRHSSTSAAAEHADTIVHIEHSEYPSSVTLGQHSPPQTLSSTKIDL